MAWYDVLFQVNVTNKVIQAKDIDISEHTKQLQDCIAFLEKYSESGCKDVIIMAKGIAEEQKIESVFKPAKHVRHVKHQFEEIASTEPTECPQK